MADNIIESLEIQFKASTKSADSAVKKLIANLGEVNVALRNVQDNSKYASSVDVVTESFNRLGESLSGLNIGGLSELSKSLKALGNLSAPKVDMSNVTRQTTQASEAVQNLSRAFAESVGADDAFDLTNVETVIQRMVELYRSGAQEVQIAVDGMLGAGGDFDADLPFADVGESISDMSSPVNEASEELESLRNELRLTAQDAISAKGEIDDFSKSLLEYIRTVGRVKIPESAIQESGDNFKSDRGVAGLGSFVTKADGVPFDAGFLEEMDAALGTQYHLIENAAGAWTKFIADVRAARDAEENMQQQLDTSSMKEAEQVTNAFVESIRKLADSGDSVVPVIQSIASSTQQMSTGTDGIRSIGESLQAIAGMELPDAANLAELGLAVGKFGLKSATQAASNMPTIAQGLSAMSGMNVTLPDPEMLSNFATSLRSFGYESMANALVNMRDIPNAVSSLSAVQSIPEVTGLDELARSVARFGYSSATRAIEQMPQLGTALNNLLTSLSQAPAVNTQTAQLINSLAQLSARSSSAGNAVGRTTRSLNLFGNTASKTSQKTFTLAGAIGKVYATYWLLFRAFGKLKDAIDISSSLTEVQNVVATTFGELTDRAEEFSKTSLETFGLSELSAKQYASRFQAMGTAMGISTGQINKASDALTKLNTVMDDRGYTAVADSMADVSINITKLAADIASFYNVEQSDAAEDLQAIFTGQTRPLRKYGLDLTQATLKEWALANGLDANIKKMSQAEKTMLRYQYVMVQTQKIQGDFAKTMLTWHNQITILKENFRRLGRVIGDGLIAALRPVVVNINKMMNGIIMSVQNVVNALGKIFGWQMIVDQTGSGLVDDTEEYAESLEDAAGNAKKLKSMLLGIDELNVLSDKDDGSGSGASSGSAGLSGGMDGNVGGIEFVDYESELNNLFSLGRKINDKLQDMMDRINWDSVYEKARSFGTGLSDFLNGLITPNMFFDLGKTIAGAINTAVQASLSFASNFDWTNLGTSIGSEINGFFENFNADDFGVSIDTWVTGLLDALIAALDTADWNLIGKKIGTVLSKLDFKKYLKKAAEALWKGFSGVLSATDSSFDLAPFETVLMSVVGLVSLLKVGKINKIVTALGSVYSTLSRFSSASAANGFLSGLTTAFPRLTGAVDNARNAMLTFDDAFTRGEGAVASLNNGIGSLTSGLSPLAQGLIAVGGSVAEFALIKDAVYDIASGTEHLAADIAELVAGIVAGAASLTLVFGFPTGLIAAGIIGITSALIGLGKAWDEEIADMQKDNIASLFENENGVEVSEIADTYADSIRNVGSGFDEITEKSKALVETRKNVKNVWSEIDQIKRAMGDGTLSVENGVASLKIAFETLSQSAKENIGASTEIILAALGENGAYAEAMENLGHSTKEAIHEIAQADEEVSARIDALIELLANPDISTDEYDAYSQELYSLIFGLDDTSKAVSSLKDKIGEVGIDFSSVVPSGEYSSEAFVTMMKGVADSVVSTRESVVASGDALSSAFNEKINGAILVGNEDLAKKLDETKSHIQEANAGIVASVNQMGSDIPNALQTEFLDKLKERISGAQEEYEQMKWWDKLWLQLTQGVYDSGDYAQRVGTQFKTEYIDPLNKDIEDMYTEMGTSAKPFASDAATEILSGIFDENVYTKAGDWNVIRSKLKTDWEEVFDGVVSDIDGYGDKEFESIGSSNVDSVATGIVGNIKAATDAVQDVVDKAIETIGSDKVYKRYFDAGEYGGEGYIRGIESKEQDAYDSGYNISEKALEGVDDGQETGSPAKQFIERGVFAVEGYAKGFEDVSLVTQGVQNMIDSVFDLFEGIPDQMYSVGQSIGNSMAEGINSAYTNVSNAVNGIIEAVNSAINAINSLKDVVNSANSLKVNIPEVPSVPKFATGGFPEDGFFFANHNELVGSFPNGQTAVANNEQIVAGIQRGVETAVSASLVPYLSQIAASTAATAQKDFSVNIGDRDIAKANSRGSRQLGMSIISTT